MFNRVKSFWKAAPLRHKVLAAFVVLMGVLIVVSVAARAQQVIDYDANDLFARTAYGDSLSSTTDTTYSFNGGADQIVIRFPILDVENAGADTVTSREIALQNGGNDISIYVNFDNQSGTANTLARLGIIKAREQGIVWYNMASALQSDTSFVYSVGAQTWGPQDVLSSLLIQFQETGSQANEYGVRVRHFRWK